MGRSGYQDSEEDIEEHNDDEEVEHKEETRSHRLPAKSAVQICKIKQGRLPRKHIARARQIAILAM